MSTCTSHARCPAHARVALAGDKLGAGACAKAAAKSEDARRRRALPFCSRDLRSLCRARSRSWRRRSLPPHFLCCQPRSERVAPRAWLACAHSWLPKVLTAVSLQRDACRAALAETSAVAAAVIRAAAAAAARRVVVQARP